MKLAGFSTIFRLLFVITGVAIVIIGAIAFSGQFEEPKTRSLPEFQVQDKKNNPVGFLSLHFSTEKIFSVDNPVRVQAVFQPSGLEYEAYALYFHDSHPESAQVVLKRVESEFVGEGEIEWLIPGVKSLQIDRYLLNRSQRCCDTVSVVQDIKISVAPEEALESARTNKALIELAVIGLGITVIGLSKPHKISRRQVSLTKGQIRTLDPRFTRLTIHYSRRTDNPDTHSPARPRYVTNNNTNQAYWVSDLIEPYVKRHRVQWHSYDDGKALRAYFRKNKITLHERDPTPDELGLSLEGKDGELFWKAINPPIYVPVTLPDSRVKNKRDTSHEQACEEPLCQRAHSDAKYNPGWTQSGHPKTSECGCTCHCTIKYPD